MIVESIQKISALLQPKSQEISPHFPLRAPDRILDTTILSNGTQCVFVEKQAPGLFEESFEAWVLSESKKSGGNKYFRVGFYTIEVMNKRESNPLLFLNIPPTETPFPVYMGNMEVAEEFRSKGIANKLFENSMEWMRDRRCLHVVVFSNDGNQRLRHKFESQGYKRCDIVDSGLASKHFLPGYTGWMYKKYPELRS